MLATVLITVVAATIALGVVFSAVLATRAEANRVDYGRAAAEADRVRAAFERELADDPLFYLTRMFAYERPRKCLADATDSETARKLAANPYLAPYSDVAVAGPDWPLDLCGGVWGYPEAGSTRVRTVKLALPSTGDGPRWWSEADRDWTPTATRAEVHPDPGTGQVRLTVLATDGGAEAGLEVVYGAPSAADWSLWSGSDLDLGQVLHRSASAAPGSLGAGSAAFSAGVLRVPETGVDVQSAVLAADGGVFGEVPSGTQVWSGRVGAGSFDNSLSRPGTRVLSEVVDPIPTAPLLQASAAALDVAGCADGGQVPQNMTAKRLTTLLCLRPGQQVVTADGIRVAVPADARMILLVPTGASAATAGLKVLYSTSPMVAEGSCLLSGCDPSGADALAAAAGAHIQSPLTGSGTQWKLLGDFFYPSTGVVATGVDTVVGRCTGFTGASCAAEPGETDGGWRFAAPLTVWAGSSSAPADLWVAGPVRSAVPVGLVAAGRVLIPSFASPSGVSLDLSAQVVALGRGVSDTAPLTGWPSGFAGAGFPVAVHGSLAATRTGALSTVTTMGVSPMLSSTTTRAVPAPHLPGFSQTPRAQTSRQVSPAELCAADGAAASTTSCVGRW